MKKTLLFLITLLLLLPLPASAASVSPARAALHVSDKADYLDDWSMLALARSGGEDGFSALAAEYAVLQVFRLYRNGGALPIGSETEYARVALTLTALGYRADSFGGFDLLAPLAETERLSARSLNGLIFSLLALDAGAYATADGTREAIVTELLCRRGEAGGWSVFGTDASADPDMTAMALTALSPYRASAEVSSAIEDGLAVLRDLQTVSGGYVSLGVENSESAAQVILALATLGEDPKTFTSEGNSVLDALLAYQTGGGFAHTVGGEVNRLATVQASFALEAYRRASSGEPTVYQMTDVIAHPPVAFTDADAEAALALPLTETVAVEDRLSDLLGRLLLSPSRGEYRAAEAHLGAAVAALESAYARLDRLAAACRALPIKIGVKDRETVRALRQEISSLPSEDRARLAEQVYLDEAESALAVIDRTRILTVAISALAAVSASVLMIRMLLRRRRAAADETEGEE